MSQALPDSSLDTLFREARSFSYWQDKPVSEDQLKALYELFKMGPTAANSCPARVVFVSSEEAKQRLKPCLAEGNVDKSMSAPVVASAFHPALAPVGVLLAVLGYALGTYCAYLTGLVLQALAA